MAVDVGPLNWEKFKGPSLYWLFPLYVREAKVQEFINLRQGNISLMEYSLKFHSIV